MKRWISLLLTLALALGLSVPACAAPLTRGETVTILQNAADAYHPDLQKGDIIRGYEDGQLREDEPVTATQALVMLFRAFGGLPALTGHNARAALPPVDPTAAPTWAKDDVAKVLSAGITESYDPNATLEQSDLDTLITRVYALFGTNEKDDFYATVNKEGLETAVILPGNSKAGSLYDLRDITIKQVTGILQELSTGTYETGTPEQKISDFYRSILDWDGRNAAGITPIAEYLSMIDAAADLASLEAVQITLMKELALTPFFSFDLAVDNKDSNRYILYFHTAEAGMDKSFYTSATEAQKEAYLRYLSALLVLSGETESDAAAHAQAVYALESKLAAATLNPEDYYNVDKIYNLFTMQELQKLFPHSDLSAVLAAAGLKEEAQILVWDTGLTQAFAALFTEDNLSALKTAAKLSMLSGYGGALQKDFIDAANRFDQEYLGISGSTPDEEVAAANIQNLMPDYIGQIYAERYCSPAIKQDVESIVQDILAVYRKRIKALDWMSAETKEKALEKLDTMGIKIGYPDSWKSPLDTVAILSPKQGGSFFSNTVAITKALMADSASHQGQPVDKTEWGMYPYTVNACYNPIANDITFPAAILQPPFYDASASYEENLGGIGYVIAHEITHAFDNNGAKYDKNGNAADWWTAEDYAAFGEKCDKMIAFYDGQESIPGVSTNGTQTLSENVADNGSAQCLSQIVREKGGDHALLYRAIAKIWLSTTTRENAAHMAQIDVHSADKLRVNRVVVNCDEFYSAIGVQAGDGMYVAPADRVVIW